MSNPHPVTPPPARLSATVLLVRDAPTLEVLLVERHAAQYYSSALVFPGGVVDPEDAAPAWRELTTGGEGLSEAQRSLRVAGFRELFEETGALVGRPIPQAKAGVPPGAFGEALTSRGVGLDLDALHPFAHWVTPEFAPKRFDTHFFLCGEPVLDDLICDQTETVSVEWMSPREALDRWAADNSLIVFPTRMNLMRLAESRSVDEAITAAKRRPQVTAVPEKQLRPDGLYIGLPETAGYGSDARDRMGRSPEPRKA